MTELRKLICLLSNLENRQNFNENTEVNLTPVFLQKMMSVRNFLTFWICGDKTIGPICAILWRISTLLQKILNPLASKWNTYPLRRLGSTIDHDAKELEFLPMALLPTHVHGKRHCRKKIIGGFCTNRISSSGIDWPSKKWLKETEKNWFLFVKKIVKFKCVKF